MDENTKNTEDINSEENTDVNDSIKDVDDNVEKDYVLPTDKKNLPIKRTPVMIGQQGFSFDNVPETSVIALTPDQAASKFLSKYMEVVDPIETYSDYFNGTAKSIDYLFREIKVFHKKLVTNGTWTERKYVASINNILEHKMMFGIIALDRAGLMYDRGLLDPANKSTRVERRRIR